jgi:hypothetical protein
MNIYFRQDLKQALIEAIASKGPNKGQLKSKCPKVGTFGSAAWNAIQSFANPYKVGMCHVFFMNEDKRKVYHFIMRFIKIKKIDVRFLDRDRVILESIGIW